jgi:hypothetical protein
VPASVPSLCHSSIPLLPSKAMKYRLPLAQVNLVGDPLLLPGQITLTRTVPASVPSLCHSSIPLLPSLAAKYRLPFQLTRRVGLELQLPGQISLT